MHSCTLEFIWKESVGGLERSNWETKTKNTTHWDKKKKKLGPANQVFAG